ncbi:MAG: DUF2232 domain-containing protein [Cellulosilyticum sp.]|nr:DUF2232 domain-containing protein [Cellulosilyticum sp.]
MEDDKKNVIKFIGIMIIYILLSALGIFGQVGMALMPIVSIPFALYCMKNKMTLQFHIIFHIVVSASIYLMMQNVLGILIYIVSVVAPAYMILYLYKQRLTLPNMIMYGGLLLSGIAFVYFAVMKGIGFDFEAQFGAVLDTITKEFSMTLENVISMGNTTGVNISELQATAAQTKELVAISMETLKAFYPAIVVSQIIICFGISIMIFNTLARRKVKGLPSTGQILEYRLSKVAVVLLMIAMVLTDTSNSSSNEILLLALNLMSFLTNFFEITGALSLIALLRNTAVGRGIKLLGYVGIVLLFILSPYLLMFYGCLDAIFNYRKVSIVV